MVNKKFTSRVNAFMASCKNASLTFLRSMPHHWLRAALFLGLSIYLLYLLKCFTTIPVKDYYFDISALFSDSVVPDIRVLVGDENVMNTYSEDFQAHGDSIYIAYNFFPRTTPQRLMQRLSTGEVFHPAVSRVVPIIDTISHRSKTNTLYRSAFNNMQQFTCIYTHYYVNAFSSVPIGYKRGKQVYPLDGRDVFYTQGNDDEGWSNIIGGLYQDTTLAGKLSHKHTYFRGNHVVIRPKCEKSTELNVPVCPDHAGYRQGMYKLSPRLVLLFSKENIAMQQYHFDVKTAGIDAYKISLHTRGGAVIQNNPSDELKVLSLHDTQITKKDPYQYNVAYHQDVWQRLDKDFKETDVYVQIPENDALQYIRLFFITLLLSEILVAFFRNIAKGIKGCLRMRANNNKEE